MFPTIDVAIVRSNQAWHTQDPSNTRTNERFVTGIRFITVLRIRLYGFGFFSLRQGLGPLNYSPTGFPELTHYGSQAYSWESLYSDLPASFPELNRNHISSSSTKIRRIL